MFVLYFKMILGKTEQTPAPIISDLQDYIVYHNLL